MLWLMISVVSCCVLQACTTQQWYDAARGGRQNECAKLADSDERARCFDAANQRYEQYIRDQNDKPKE